MLVAAAVGYGRRELMALARLPSHQNYLCSGANIGHAPITANNASVSTAAGFSVNTAAGNDHHDITATAPCPCVYRHQRLAAHFGSGPDLLVGCPAVLCRHARQRHHRYQWRAPAATTVLPVPPRPRRAATVTANGNATGTAGHGIHARNYGTALSVTTAAGTTVSGTNGIYARNYGTGAVTLTANGNVTGTGSYGIVAINSNT